MSTIKDSLAAALAISAASLLVIGCSSHSDVPVTPIPDGGYVYDAGAANFPPPTPDAGPPAPVAATAPCDPVQTTAMTTMFMARQKAEVAGMNPEGATVCGVVPDGQSVSSQTFVLQPGHCYSVLAQALPNVSQVDVELDLDLATGLPPVLAALAGKPLLAVGESNGVQAILGGKGNCYQWPWPIPAAVKITVKSKAGAGVVAAQAYSKKK